MDAAKDLRKLIDEAGHIVFFGGAGVSTESGIPDFRSEKGLYHARLDYGRSPEEMVSHSFFAGDTDTFYRYYRESLVFDEAKPNPAHLALAALEKAGKDIAIVTQNIDGLHQKAGSKKIYELHGSGQRYYCLSCGAAYDLGYILDEKHCSAPGKNTKYVPYCESCGGIVRPDVVLYEEGLDSSVIAGAVSAIEKADLMIVGGTSLVVYPAAGFLNYFSGKDLVLINMSPTDYDGRASLVIREPIGKVFERLGCSGGSVYK
ncbi:MAG: NAD-dependent protein deacylase [Clostridiales Family XIII bacterium]|nr:NAD-dependent protein deacylase [Clostridiales Family XIII bacterium]